MLYKNKYIKYKKKYFLLKNILLGGTSQKTIYFSHGGLDNPYTNSFIVLDIQDEHNYGILIRDLNKILIDVINKIKKDVEMELFSFKITCEYDLLCDEKQVSEDKPITVNETKVSEKLNSIDISELKFSKIFNFKDIITICYSKISLRIIVLDEKIMYELIEYKMRRINTVRDIEHDADAGTGPPSDAGAGTGPPSDADVDAVSDAGSEYSEIKGIPHPTSFPIVDDDHCYYSFIMTNSDINMRHNDHEHEQLISCIPVINSEIILRRKRIKDDNTINFFFFYELF